MEAFKLAFFATLGYALAVLTFMVTMGVAGVIFFYWLIGL